MMVLIASMVFASPPNEKNMTNTKANDNALMTTANTDMSFPPPTLQVWTDSSAISSTGENGTVDSTGNSKKNESANSAVAATKFKSESFEISHMTNMTANTDITATTDEKEESSPPAAAATNYFCSERFTSYTMTAETAPTTSTSKQMGNLATEGDFPLKFI